MTELATCAACGRIDAKVRADEIAHAMFACSDCGARTAFGKLLPREVVEPFTDERGHRWIRRRFQDPKTKQDLYVVDLPPMMAAIEAKNILSLVLP